MTRNTKFGLLILKQESVALRLKRVSVNIELLKLYWSMGKDIVDRQKNAKWSDSFLLRLSKDLMTEFPVPWGHNIAIISKCKNINEALYYVQNTITHNWSRNVLVHQN